jgi:hypothetical protein
VFQWLNGSMDQWINSCMNDGIKVKMSICLSIVSLIENHVNETKPIDLQKYSLERRSND